MYLEFETKTHKAGNECLLYVLYFRFLFSVVVYVSVFFAIRIPGTICFD